MCKAEVKVKGDKMEKNYWDGKVNLICSYCEKYHSFQQADRRIIVLKRVRGDWPIGHHLIAEPGVYTPYVNPHGAVSVKIGGEILGLKPSEFQWLDESVKEE